MRIPRPFVLVAVAGLMLAACGKKEGEAPTPSSIDLVMQVRQCARLHTAEYTIHKIVTYDDVVRMKGRFLSDSFNIALPLGDRKVAIPIDVTLSAYVDFSHFDKENVEREGTKISITLPDPQVVVSASKVDHAGVRSFVGVMRSRFSDKELSDFARQGEEQIVSHIADYGILETARRSAARVLVPLLVRMGYAADDVTVHFRRDLDADALRRSVEPL